MSRKGNRMQVARWAVNLWSLVLAGLIAMPLYAATFSGNARVEVNDPTGSLGLSTSSNSLTVSCWFKMAVPSDQTVSENMTILANGKDGNENGTYAYLIRYNASNGNVEFLSKGSAGTHTQTLIENPYLDRWYHLATVRQGQNFSSFVDGRSIPAGAGVAGNSATTNGLSIGGWGAGKYLYGEVQEVAIYQSSVDSGLIRDRMFQDQRSSANLKGYYKLGYTSNTNDWYRNFVPTPPPGTDPGLALGAGTVTFEETDQGGEQSTFDSRRNGGQDAIAPLSGSFTWEQTVLARPVTGIAFDFRIGYSSGIAYSGSEAGETDPYAHRVLGRGWRHSFDVRIMPVQIINERRLLTWDGAIETWVMTNNVWKTRHNEYRGDLIQLGNGDFEWVTPERLTYRFRNPMMGSFMSGRLDEIRDLNSNTLQLAWNEIDGMVTQVVDTVGGAYAFNYDLSRGVLTNVCFQGWNIHFLYDGEMRLTNKYVTAPDGYAKVNTSWSFAYDVANGLLNRITDPRSNATAWVAYDRYGRVTNIVDALNRATRTEYNRPAKRQIRRTDPGGFPWVDTFDRKGRLTNSVDALGYATSYAYDDRGNIICETDALGRKTYYAYDERGNKTAETNALGQVTQWTYNEFNKPTRSIDPLNWSMFYDYDAAANLTRQHDALGEMVSYAYTSKGLVATATDGNGNTNRFVYTLAGFLAASIDPAGNTNSYTSNELGWPMSTVNALGQVTTFSYDINGKVVRTVDPLNRVFTAVYDPNGNLVTASDGKGRLTTHAYDAEDQRTQTVDRANAEWRTAWTPRGQVATQVDPLCYTNRFFYDNANRLTNVVDALVNSESYQYDGNDNRVWTIDKLGQRWRTEFDALDRPVAKTDPLGNTVETTYDAAGRIKTITSPNGYPSTHEYDGRGRLRRWVDAENYVWLYDYDGNGNITNVTDALGGHYVMAYGPRNERILERNQDANEWHYAYDELMRVKRQQDPNGLIRAANYDAGGRPIEVNYSSGRVDTFAYDENNNPEVGTRSGSGPATSTQLYYDELDRVVEYKDHFGNRVKYRYDQRGSVTNIIYPGNLTLRQSFDALGRMTNQTDWAGRRMMYTYDQANRLICRTYPNGVTQTNAFDSAGRISDLMYQTVAVHRVYEELIWLPLDGDGGATDASGNGHTGAVYGATLTTGHAGAASSAYWFDGVDDYIEVAHTTNLNFTTGGFALCAWIRFSDDLRDNHIVGKHTTGTYNGYMLRIVDRKPEFDLWGDQLQATAERNDGLWHHVVGTWDGTTRKLYVDGVLANSAQGAKPMTPNAAPMCIGRAMTSVYFKGDIDDVRVYARALSAAEVGNLYAGGGSPPVYEQRMGTQIALSYAYDHNGNKTAATEQGTLDWAQPSLVNETARYTPVNRLIDRLDATNTNRSFRYQYDPSGNMTNAVSAEQGYTLRYDEDNRVTAIYWNLFPLTVKSVSNRYDVLGRRLSRRADGVETRYVLNVVGDMERVLCDQNAAGQITAYYIHGPDLTYAVDTNGNVINYHADAQGNVIALTDSNQTVVAQYAYTPYGRCLGGSVLSNQCSMVSHNPYLFVGSQGVMQEIAAGDLYFMRARYYSAEAGCFLSTDPVKRIGPGWKPVAYVYADGNPLYSYDPAGLRSVVGVPWQGIVDKANDVGPAYKCAGIKKVCGVDSEPSDAPGDWAAKYHDIAGTAVWNASQALGGVPGYVVGLAGTLAVDTGLQVALKLDMRYSQDKGAMVVAFSGPAQLVNSVRFTADYMKSEANRQIMPPAAMDDGGNGNRSPMVNKTPDAVVHALAVGAVTSTMTAASSTAKTVSSTAKTAVQKTQEVVSQVKQVAQKVAEKAKTAVSQVKNTVTSAVKSVASKVKSFFSKGKKK